MNVNVPAARAWPNCPPEFYRFFLKVASSANSTAGETLTNIDQRLTAVEQSGKQKIQGASSIQTQGGSSGYLYVTLQGDVTTPGNTQYYGTDSTGKRGWFNVSDALGSAFLGDLGDVSATTPTDKYVLTWDATTSTWGPALSGGLPAGGTTGQVLTKASSADGDAGWQDPSGGIASVVPGSHITVDNTDPANPVVGVSSLTSSTSYAEGASFPTSPAPALNDKFYRTDLNLLCYYDGTRWLTVQEYPVGIGSLDALNPLTGGTNAFRWPVPNAFGIYLERIAISALVLSTNNATNYWTGTFSWFSATNTGTTIATKNTSASTVANWASLDTSVAGVLSSSAYELQLVWSRTGSPGNLYAAATLFYRLIVT